MHTDQFGIDELKEQLRAAVVKKLNNARYWLKVHTDEYELARKRDDMDMMIACDSEAKAMEWMLRWLDESAL